MVTTLPLEMWGLICDRIAFDDIRALACTCKYLKDLPNQNFFYRLVLPATVAPTTTILTAAKQSFPFITRRDPEDGLSFVRFYMESKLYPITSVNVFSFKTLKFTYTRLSHDKMNCKYDFCLSPADEIVDNEIVVKIWLRRYLITEEDKLKATARMTRYRRNRVAFWKRHQITEAA